MSDNPHPWYHLRSDFDGPLVERARKSGGRRLNSQLFGTQHLLDITDPPRTAINITDDDELSRGFTITLVAPPMVPDWAASAGLMRGRATIMWGNGGSIAQAQVDFCQSIAIPLSGSAVRVDVQNISTAAGVFSFGAFISYGPASRQHQPTFTNYTDIVIAPGAMGLIGIIPPFAKSVVVHRQPLEPIAYMFVGAAATVIATYQIPVGQICPTLPVPPDAYWTSMNHLGAINPITARREVFNLAL